MARAETENTARSGSAKATRAGERTRKLCLWPALDILRTDFRFAFRQSRKSPGFAVTAILTLSLGIAAAIAIFGFVDAALIRPLPYHDLSHLMGVFKTTQLGSRHAGYSYPDYLDLVRSNRDFSSIAAYDSDGGFILSKAGTLHLVSGTGVTSDFFRILGVTPILGSDFAPHRADEDLLAAPSTVILSYAAWQTWFGGSPSVLGKTVALSGKPYTVIGVLPRSFEFPPVGAADFWTTLRPYAGDPCFSSRGCMAMDVIARLKPGVTMQQAFVGLRALAAREARLHPDPDRNRGANIAPLGRWIVGDIQPILLTLLAGAGLLLLIAFVNVAGLLLVRSENRRREFAVRGVLGASRVRLTQQLIAESLVVVVASAALGLFAAAFARRLLLGLLPADTLDSMPYLRNGWNWHVVAFAAALVLLACALFAIAPALRLPFANLRAGLSEGGRAASGAHWRRLGAKLVVLELATTMVLLAGAGLLGKSLYRLLHVDFGFVPNHLATLSVLAPEAKYVHADQALALQNEILSRLGTLPGVSAVGTARTLPVTGVPSTQIGIVGQPGLGESNEVGHQVTSAGYLSAVLKAQFIEGRDFNENDRASASSVVIINLTLARRYFPHENPIGRQVFYHQHGSAPAMSGPQHPLRVVGVIADIKEDALDSKATPVVYSPASGWPDRSYTLAVRTSLPAASFLPSLIAAIHEIDPQILVLGPATMSRIIQRSWAAYLHRLMAWMAAGFAALALLLSSVGLYGIIAYSVSRRTREIGVRMAMGAQRSSVYQLILREAAWLTFIGLAIGLSGALAAGIFMRSLLFGVRSWDISIMAAVAALVALSALLASYNPARRAASVDPVNALRAE